MKKIIAGTMKRRLALSRFRNRSLAASLSQSITSGFFIRGPLVRRLRSPQRRDIGGSADDRRGILEDFSGRPEPSHPYIEDEILKNKQKRGRLPRPRIIIVSTKQTTVPIGLLVVASTCLVGEFMPASKQSAGQLPKLG